MEVRVRSTRYVLMDKVLYKRGFSQPYLRCLAPEEANYVLREIHEGACGNHLGAKAYVKVYDQCQRFSNVPRQSLKYLTSMIAPWPFVQ